MKIIVAGSRVINQYDKISPILDDFKDSFSELVSGGARGVDRVGEIWAEENGIKIVQFLPDWSKYGRIAGIIRNEEMAEYADFLLAFWDGQSKGTKHMMSKMEVHKKKHKLYIIR